MLKDDVVAGDAPLEVRRAAVTAIAARHAETYHGNFDYIYETALKGYAIELANEADAIAISNLPEVRWVEEDALGELGLNASRKYRLCAVILFGIVYLLVAVAFPNPPASNKMQFIWRLAAWLICVVAFALHIGLAYFRFQNSPRRTALHAALAVALGALALAAAANIHALTTGTGNPRLLALALVIWPIITGVPAFVVAFVAASVLARVRPNDKASA